MASRGESESRPPLLTVNGVLPLLPDIIQHIFDLLKSDTSPSLLAKLVRCSSALCDELSPKLYKQLVLDQANAEMLAYGLNIPSAESCSASIKDSSSASLPSHDEELLRLRTDLRPLMELTPKERKLKLLGCTEEIDLRDAEGLLGLNRILARCQTLNWCRDCSKFHHVLHSLSTIIFRSPTVAALARADYTPRPPSSGDDRDHHSSASDSSTHVYSYSDLYDMLQSAASPKHVIMESHVWALTPAELNVPPRQDRMLDSGLDDVMGAFALEWEELDTMEVRELLGFEELPDTASQQCGVPDRALDRYTVHYASKDKLSTALPELSARLPSGTTGEAQLATERIKRIKTMFEYHEDHEDLRIDDFYYDYDDGEENTDRAKTPNGEHDGYKTIFEILNDPATEGVHPDEWVRMVTGDEAFVAKMEGKVRFDIGGRDYHSSNGTR
ncbi:hypothetical protein I317_01268 [Kwoniella heveanensis CBS 569]|nr:hypothetical protein I317_01268 [Kwoniella heveanensis CBS 569]